MRMVFLPVDIDVYLTPHSTVRAWAGAVDASVAGLDVVVVEPGEDPSAVLAGADAVFGALTPGLLAAAPRLRWLQAPAAAPPSDFFFEQLVEHPVVVANLRGVYRDNLANHVMAYVLSAARALPLFAAAQRAHEWRRDAGPTITDLGASTMLIIGVGAVGTVLAARARAFGITTIGVDAKPDVVEAELDELYGPSALAEQLPRADWVVLTVPYTPETHHLIGAEQLRAMRSSAYLVNVGRGETVDLDALGAALAANTIAGAALDVFATEPLPGDHPLWDAPNLVITPHVAGFGKSTDGERQDVIVDNAARFVAGRPLRNVVDKALRY
jgi:phosphoglycerate dehydrogenase-like enzyme